MKLSDHHKFLHKKDLLDFIDLADYHFIIVTH